MAGSSGHERPRTRPRRVLADKAYGSRANRSYLRRRKIACTIPEKADQVRHRKNKGGAGGASQSSTRTCTSSATPWNGDQQAQAQPRRRHRYDKLAVRYEATTHAAAINEWLPRFLTMS